MLNGISNSGVKYVISTSTFPPFSNRNLRKFPSVSSVELISSVTSNSRSAILKYKTWSIRYRDTIISLIIENPPTIDADSSGWSLRDKNRNDRSPESNFCELIENVVTCKNHPFGLTEKDLSTWATSTVDDLRLAEFSLKWDAKFPTIAKSWRSHWARVIPFFAHPPEIRKVIYTTNAIESLKHVAAQSDQSAQLFAQR
jgi:hypothetical protein